MEKFKLMDKEEFEKAVFGMKENSPDKITLKFIKILGATLCTIIEHRKNIYGSR